MSSDQVSEKLYSLTEKQINRIWITFQEQILENGWIKKSNFFDLIKQDLGKEKIEIKLANLIINNSEFFLNNEWIKLDKNFHNASFAKDKYQLLEVFLKEKVKEDPNILNNIFLGQIKDNLFFFNRKFPFDSKFLNWEGRLENLNNETKKFIIEKLIDTVIADFKNDKNSKLFFSIFNEAKNFGDWKSIELAKIEGLEIEIPEDINFLKKEENNFFDFSKSNIEVISKFLKNNNSIEYIFSKFYENGKENNFEKSYISALVQSIPRKKLEK